SNALKRFYNSIMVRSDAIIANSQWTADHIVEEHGIARDKIHVVPRGVDFAEFDPAKVGADRVRAMRAAWGAGERDVVVLLPGRLTRWKGQLVLIAALAELRRTAKLGNVRAVLLGDAQGRDDYVAELRTAIAADGLEDRVLIAPHTQDMPAAYMASDMVVSASTDPEAFGRVAAEAAAMGRPVIASNHGGARETVLHGVSGLLVPPDDAPALAVAIERVASMSSAERAAMGEQGRAHVRENFSLERMCADTLAVYRELIRD
ncbi:MAG TPA: glycosyltransferase family 4 protein, partial [Rhizomicrobium sp.]|nr:glycosyltransferase family 4 protein [Rhizomicrobium sp.]